MYSAKFWADFIYCGYQKLFSLINRNYTIFKMIKKYFAFLFLILFIPLFLNAQENVEKEVLRDMLTEFLNGASVNDYAIHDRFWAEDLVYTGSGGDRITKEQILNELGEQPEGEALAEYHAEDVDIRLYGDDTAVVAFKLVANIPLENGRFDTLNFYNTGTFIKRSGEWRAVAWQATQIP